MSPIITLLSCHQNPCPLGRSCVLVPLFLQPISLAPFGHLLPLPPWAQVAAAWSPWTLCWRPKPISKETSKLPTNRNLCRVTLDTLPWELQAGVCVRLRLRHPFSFHLWPRGRWLLPPASPSTKEAHVTKKGFPSQNRPLDHSPGIQGLISLLGGGHRQDLTPPRITQAPSHSTGRDSGGCFWNPLCKRSRDVDPSCHLQRLAGQGRRGVREAAFWVPTERGPTVV